MRLKQSIGGSSRRFPGGMFLAVLAVIAFVGGLGFLLYEIELFGTAPKISFIGPDQTIADVSRSLVVGKSGQVHVVIENPEADICFADVKIVQNGQETTLTSYDKKKEGLEAPQTRLERPLTMPASIVEGDAILKVSARDCALWMDEAQMEQKAQVDITPPRVELTSTQHYVNQGGADVATYTVSPDTAWSGIRVGTYEFKGFKKPDAAADSRERFVIFVYSYDLAPGTPIEVIARDAAGNEGKTRLEPSKFFPKEWRQRELPVDDKFIETKVADIIAQTPELKNQGDNLKNYLQVNRELRKKNAQFLLELGQKSEEKFYWKDAFKPLGNASIEANFADYRSYLYNNEKVDQQVHLGFDMAVTEKYPIVSSATGKVIFADYLGIYGNTIIIDHGYGINTLYAHLSSMDVKPGDLVAMDQKIGNSGATGLAGGDHLHYSLLIQGVQTNPIELWDQHWIDDHVYLRLNKEWFGRQ